MNKPDSFEEKLRRQTLQPVPAAWREEILSAAREVAKTETLIAQPPAGNDSFIQYWKRLLGNLLWPHPVAWGGLAAIWLVILALNIATSDPAEPKMARDTSPPSPELRQLLREQEQMFAELIGPLEKSAAVEPKRRGSQPRSAARLEWLNA